MKCLAAPFRQRAAGTWSCIAGSPVSLGMLVRLGVVGISAIKEHMEVVHTSVKVEDYKVGSCLLTVQIKTYITVSISEGSQQASLSRPALRRPRWNVMSANFELTGFKTHFPTTGEQLIQVLRYYLV